MEKSVVYRLRCLRTGDAGGDPGQDNEQRNLPKFSLLSGRDKKTKFGLRLLIGW